MLTATVRLKRIPRRHLTCCFPFDCISQGLLRVAQGLPHLRVLVAKRCPRVDLVDLKQQLGGRSVDVQADE